MVTYGQVVPYGQAYPMVMKKAYAKAFPMVRHFLWSCAEAFPMVMCTGVPYGQAFPTVM